MSYLPETIPKILVKIVVVSFIPFFKQRVTGGAQKILRQISQYWAVTGHEVIILSPFRKETPHAFELDKNVVVKPILQLQKFPASCQTAPYNLSTLIVDIHRHTEWADVLYVLDGVLPYQFLSDNIPTVTDFHNFVFSDTLANGLSFRRDLAIVHSQYVADCLTDTFRPFCPTVQEKVEVIPYGFDLNAWQSKTTDTVRELIPLPDDAIPLLYPHRPEPSKGLYEGLKAIAKLRTRLGGAEGDKLRLLIPLWSDGESKNDSPVYHQIKDYAQELGVDHLLVFHPWIGSELMAEYYSLGKATLCLGNFIEAFGLVPVESILCGTPAIVSRVAAYRHILPEELIAKVDYGDLETAVDILEAIITGKSNFEKQILEARQFVADNYSPQRTLAAQEQAIANVELTPALPLKYAGPLQSDDTLRIPAWCYASSSGYYNDYQYAYESNSVLDRFLERVKLPLKLGDVLQLGFTEPEIESLLKTGFLVRG